MSTTIYCEGALYGPDGHELDHPNYKRHSVPVDFKDGYDGVLMWADLGGAVVSFFALLICEKVLTKTAPVAQMVAEGNTVTVPLVIAGKGYEMEEPALTYGDRS
jgi:hypothetical protein